MLALQTNIKEALRALDLLTHYNKQIKLAYFEGGKRFSSNSANIFLLDVNFENPNVGLHVIIISFMLAKFQED